jgi:DNA-binding CsgD family transcriptional regulator
MTEPLAHAWAGAGPVLDAGLRVEIAAALDELAVELPDLDKACLVDFATSVSAVQAAARELDRAIAELDDGPAKRLLLATRGLNRVCQRLYRLEQVRSCAMNQILVRLLGKLAASTYSVSELVAAAPEMLCELGFDRAMISRVEGDVWHPELIYAIGEPGSDELYKQAGAVIPQPLLPGLYETELVRERRSILVTTVRDAADPRRAHPTLVEATGTRNYVATPILSDGQVVGMLHADRYGQRKDVDELDLDLLSIFGEAFELALSRAALHDQLAAARDNSGANPTMLRVERRPGDGIDGLVVRTGSRTAESVALPASLTSREFEVLELVAEGRTNAAIAARLSITDQTVKQHVTHVMRKLGVRNRSEAVVRWFHAAQTWPHRTSSHDE